MKRKLVIVSEIFYPDSSSTAYILTKIADSLSSDYDILVISGPQSYSYDNIRHHNDKSKPYPIKRIKLRNYDKNRLIPRTIRLIVSSFKLGRELYSNTEKGDDVLIVTNPAPFLIIAAIIKHIKRFKLSILVHDVFPENAIAAGVIKSNKNLAYRMVRSIFKWAYSSADRLITIGRDMQRLFENKFTNTKSNTEISVIENWADKCDITKTYDRDSEKIRILYAGNIGRCQGIEDFIHYYETASNPNLEFSLRGGGALVNQIKHEISQADDSSIHLGDSYSRDEQFTILNECDICLVTLADGMLGLGVPSKSYNIMASGKPILYIGNADSEIALVIKEYGIGYWFDNSDTDGLVNWLKSLTPDMLPEFYEKGQKARVLAETIYSERTILSKYAELFS